MHKIKLGHNCDLDLDKLIQSRLIIQANSGGGKSHTIRRLLEQSHGSVQQLVIDTEGEFATLREKYDYVLAAPRGGDCIAHPDTARILALKLLELRASAVIDVFELKPKEREAFVANFLEALVDAPRDLWHPCLIVLDEAQLYCPETARKSDLGPCTTAVIDLCARGRKRGFCAVLCTNRLSVLSKDAAANCNNRLIGRTSLDVDVKRAEAELGFARGKAPIALRQLQPELGEFYAYGPALCQDVELIHVGEVLTTHPKVGKKARHDAPPPPTDKIRALLPQLSDLPAQAEDLDPKQIKAKNKKLEAEVAKKKEDIDVYLHKIYSIEFENESLRQQLHDLPDSAIMEKHLASSIASAVAQATDPLLDTMQTSIRALQEVHETTDRLINRLHESQQKGIAAKHEPVMPVRAPEGRAIVAKVTVASGDWKPKDVPTPALKAAIERVGAENLGGYLQDNLDGPIRRVVNGLAELHACGIQNVPRILVCYMAGYQHPNTKSFANALSKCSTAGLLDYPVAKHVALTDVGRAAASDEIRPPRSRAELHERIFKVLGDTAEKIVRPLIQAYPDAIARDTLANLAGYQHVNTKTFANALSKCSSLGLLSYPVPRMVQASSVLFPKELP